MNERMVLNVSTCRHLIKELKGMFFRSTYNGHWFFYEVSQYCGKLLGYSQKELIAKLSMELLIHKDDLVYFLFERERALKNKSPINIEYRFFDKSGEGHYVQEISTPIYDEKGGFLFLEGFLQEISVKRKLAVVNNWQVSVRRALASSSLVSVTDTDGAILEANEMFCAKAQYSEAELIGNTHKLINSGYHPDEFFADLWKTISGGLVWRGEVKNKAKDGSYFWVDSTISAILSDKGTIIQYLAIQNEITDRKIAEKKLLINEERLKSIYEHFPGMFLTINKNFIITFTNRVVKGLEKSEVIGSNVLDYVHPKHHEQYVKNINLAFAGEISEFEVESIGENGSKADYLVRMAGIKRKNEIKHVVIIPTDITDLKNKQNEINQYRKHFSLSRDMMCISYLNGMFKEVNPRFTELLGYSKKKLLESPYIEFVHPDDIEKTLEVNENLAKGKPVVDFINRYRCKDGTYKFIEWSAVPDLESKTVFATARDISEWVENSRERESLLEIINQASSEIYVFHDNTLKFKYVNASALNNLGYSQSEIREFTPAFLTPQSTKRSVYDQLEPLRDGSKRIIVIESVHERKNGTQYPVEVRVQRTYYGEEPVFLAFVTDITVRQAQEKRLKSALRLTKAIVDSTDQLFYIIQVKKKGEKGFRISYISPHSRTYYGYEPNEVKKDPKILDLSIHPDDQQTTKKKYDALMRSKKPISRIYRLKNAKTGRYRWVQDYGYPVFNRENEIVEIYGSIKDIDELKQNETTLDGLISELTNRNNELTQFNFVVSHNLRSNIANILGVSELIELKDTSIEEKEELLPFISKSVRKLDELVRDLTVILNIKSEKTKPERKIIMKSLIDDVIQSFELDVKAAQSTISVDISKNCEHITSIKSYVESIFHNLIGNALKYRNQNIDSKIHISVSKDGGIVEFIISDNGLGIDLELHKGSMFGMYKRFHEGVDGKGIGLYMTKLQVDALGGQIELQSEKGKGTTFIVKIPDSEA
ncbi:MAG: PAS domain S-box protein [Flavobacteriales bacterium]|nr:PAS domain S-box protein [Flavobacteriales bacterium]